MTEQEKMEKVIKWLECCGYSRFMDKCQECPYDGKDCFHRLKTDAIALLKAQEPVVHGRWVKMTGMMPPEYHGHYECSECKWHMKGLRNSWTREEELLYCPNCGAKMDGERRDDDGKDA